MIYIAAAATSNSVLISNAIKINEVIIFKILLKNHIKFIYLPSCCTSLLYDGTITNDMRLSIVFLLPFLELSIVTIDNYVFSLALIQINQEMKQTFFMAFR